MNFLARGHSSISSQHQKALHSVHAKIDSSNLCRLSADTNLHRVEYKNIANHHFAFAVLAVTRKRPLQRHLVSLLEREKKKHRPLSVQLCDLCLEERTSCHKKPQAAMTDRTLRQRVSCITTTPCRLPGKTALWVCMGSTMLASKTTLSSCVKNPHNTRSTRYAIVYGNGTPHFRATMAAPTQTSQ